MLNQTVLVGRLTDKPEVKELEDGKKVCNVTLAVPRSYKNENGEYDTDFIPVVLWNAIAGNVVEYVTKGDIVGIKGRLENRDTGLTLIAEKVTFLSSNKDKGEE